MTTSPQQRREIARQSGVTLVELMIVVAIIGILAAVAVFMFSKSAAKARASEVPAMFAELRIKQEGYHLENGVYLSTGAYYPRAPASLTADAAAFYPLPAAPSPWRALRINSDKDSVYCSYKAVAGTPSDTPGAEANAFGFTGTQPTNWFYMLAQCELDGDTSQHSTYFAQSGVDGQAVENPGK